MDEKDKYDVFDKSKVGTYSPCAFTGGGKRYDRILEYRVWTKDNNGELSMDSFDDYNDALNFYKYADGIYSHFVVLVEQDWYYDKDNNKIDEKRITEWKPDWL